MKQTQYRRGNGKKLEGNALAKQFARDTLGMMLAMVYVKTKSAGLHLRVHKFDGEVSPPAKDQDETRLNVEVADGLVRKVWIG